MRATWAFVILAALIGLLALVRLAVLKAVKMSEAKPVKAGHRSGLRVIFGCGHEDRRTAVIHLSNGEALIRSVPKPDASDKSCHDCYVATGRNDVNKD